MVGDDGPGGHGSSGSWAFFNKMPAFLSSSCYWLQRLLNEGL